ncbi:hypothetical protein JCM33374_g876 [Metschnikowia sp. JCM 33374]|nr:hypothetical protein JCM33374_g876 [Metschnikowia sp. JCM 33374]
MSYILDPHKGICFSSEKHKHSSLVYSDGLDQFDWQLVLPHIDTPDSTSPTDEGVADQPKKKGKDARRERKEMKKQKKAAQLAAVAHAKSSRAVGSSSSSSGASEFNPYVTKKRIMDLHMHLSRATEGDENTKLFKFGSVDIYKADVNYLLPGEWLNDNNISFVYEMILTYFLKEQSFGFHIQLLFPALIQLFLHYPVEEDLQGILPMKELAKSKLVFLPFNFIDSDDYVDLEDANNGDHWALCVLSIPERKLFVYDSMGFDGDDEDDRLLHKLAQRLQKALFRPKEKIVILKMKCDQQQNFDDCGVQPDDGPVEDIRNR